MEAKIEASPCKIVIVEGNISAGKSTLCRTLATQLGYVLYLEPTVENPFLEHFYKDPKKYALPMQIWLLKQRFVTYIKAVKYCMNNTDNISGVILDRSIFSDIVFAEKNMMDQNISKEGYEYYLTLRQRFLSCVPEPDVVVYLNASPEVCYERIHKLRQRSCEGGIPLEYLAGLDQCYQNFVTGMRDTVASVLSVDWDVFGTAELMEQFIRNAKTHPLKDRMEHPQKLLELLETPELVNKAMIMETVLPEAMDVGVEVADPDFITASEVRVMPPSPSSLAPTPSSEFQEDPSVSSTRGVKRSLPEPVELLAEGAATSETPRRAGKVRNIDVSPTGVMEVVVGGTAPSAEVAEGAAPGEL